MGLLVCSTLCLLLVKFSSEFGVDMCHKGFIDVEEDRNTTLWCDNLVQSLDVVWNLNDDGRVYEIALCQQCGICPMKCDNPFPPRFTAVRTYATSRLVVVNPRREDGGKTIECVNGIRIAGACDIRVVRKAELQDAAVTLHNNWTVTGTVSFHSLFASDNIIICRWYSTVHGTTTPLETPTTNLSTYQVGIRWYFRGKCEVNTELPSSEGQHNCSVEMFPGHGPVFAGMINTERPGKLTALNNTCPAYVAEGRDVRCQCGHLTAQQGSPPAYVSWEHNTVSPVLELDNVKRQQSGNVYRCRSVWGAGEEIVAYYNYTLQVAYGPTNAVIESTFNSGPAQNTTLTCTSDDVFPAVIFSWSVTCLTLNSTRQSSACTATPEVITNVTEVVCTVSNVLLPDSHATAIFTIGGTHDDENTGVTVVFVLGGVGCVALVAVVVVVIVVIVCKCRGTTYDKLRRRRHRETSHKYLDLHHGTNTASAPSQQIIFADHNNTARASDAVPNYIEIIGEDPVCEHSAAYVNQLPAPDSEHDEYHYYSQVKDPVAADSESTDTETSVYEEVK